MISSAAELDPVKDLIAYPYPTLSPRDKFYRLLIADNIIRKISLIEEKAPNTFSLDGYLIAVLAAENYHTLNCLVSFLKNYHEWDNHPRVVVEKLIALKQESLSSMNDYAIKRLAEYEHDEFSKQRVVIQKRFDTSPIVAEFYRLAIECQTMDPSTAMDCFVAAIKTCGDLLQVPIFAVNFAKIKSLYMQQIASLPRTLSHFTKDPLVHLFKGMITANNNLTDFIDSIRKNLTIPLEKKLRTMNINETNVADLILYCRLFLNIQYLLIQNDEKYKRRRNQILKKSNGFIKAAVSKLYTLLETSEELDKLKILCTIFLLFRPENISSDIKPLSDHEIQLISLSTQLATNYTQLIYRDKKYLQHALEFHSFILWFGDAAPKMFTRGVCSEHDESYFLLLRNVQVPREELIYNRDQIHLELDKPTVSKNNKKKKKRKNMKKKKKIPPVTHQSMPSPAALISSNEKDLLEQKNKEEFMQEQKALEENKKKQEELDKIQKEIIKKQKQVEEKKERESKRHENNLKQLQLQKELETKQQHEIALVTQREIERQKLVNELQQQEQKIEEKKSVDEIAYQKSRQSTRIINKLLAIQPTVSYTGSFNKIQTELNQFVSNYFKQKKHAPMFYYIVGGYTRFVLGYDNVLHDIDMIVSLDEAEWIGKYKKKLNAQTIMLDTLQKIAIDITPKPRKFLGDIETLLGDARTRDFTISALYLDPINIGKLKITKKDVIDPTKSGLNDLDSGILRTIEEIFADKNPSAQLKAACNSLKLDPKRIIRAALWLGSALPDKPRNATVALDAALHLSGNLFQPWLDDFDKDKKYKGKFKFFLKKLSYGNPFKTFQYLYQWGVIDRLFPQFTNVLKNPEIWSQLTNISPPNIFKFIALLCFNLFIKTDSRHKIFINPPRVIDLNYEYDQAASLLNCISENPFLKYIFELKPMVFKDEWNNLISNYRDTISNDAVAPSLKIRSLA